MKHYNLRYNENKLSNEPEYCQPIIYDPANPQEFTIYLQFNEVDNPDVFGSTAMSVLFKRCDGTTFSPSSPDVNLDVYYYTSGDGLKLINFVMRLNPSFMDLYCSTICKFYLEFVGGTGSYTSECYECQDPCDNYVCLESAYTCYDLAGFYYGIPKSFVSIGLNHVSNYASPYIFERYRNITCIKGAYISKPSTIESEYDNGCNKLKTYITRNFVLQTDRVPYYVGEELEVVLSDNNVQVVELGEMIITDTTPIVSLCDTVNGMTHTREVRIDTAFTQCKIELNNGCNDACYDCCHQLLYILQPTLSPSNLITAGSIDFLFSAPVNVANTNIFDGMAQPFIIDLLQAQLSLVGITSVKYEYEIVQGFAQIDVIRIYIPSSTAITIPTPIEYTAGGTQRPAYALVRVCKPTDGTGVNFTVQSTNLAALALDTMIPPGIDQPYDPAMCS